MKRIKIPFFVIVLITLIACGSCEDGVVGTGFDRKEPLNLFIDGTAQKGPFLLGSKVSIGRLLPNGLPASDYTSETYDDMGNFQIFADNLTPMLLPLKDYTSMKFTTSFRLPSYN